MSISARVDAFEFWLRASGTPDEIASFNRSIVEGFIAVAGSDPVTSEHIAISVSLARDAGIEVTAMEVLGKLVVRYDGSGDPSVAPTPRAATAPPVAQAKAPNVSPLKMSFRESGPATIVAATADAETSVAIVDKPPPASSIATVVAPAPRAERRLPKWIVPGAIVIVLGAGIAFAVIRRSAAEPAAEPTAPVVDHLHRVPQLALDAEFPVGWRVADDSRAPAAANTAVVFRGGTAPDPDQAVFLAALPLADDLAAGTDITDAVLLHAAHDAEVGASAHVTATGGDYETDGCVMSVVGSHTAVCRGEATQRGQTMEIRTYLRVGATRAVVALFIAKASVPSATKDAEQIVRSFKL